MAAKIYQLPTSLSGTVNIFPNFKYMVTGDNLAAVTTAGYLNQIDLQSDPISVTDVIQVLYDFNPQTQFGTYNAFSVNILDGIITLSAEINTGNVNLPVVSGNLAVFDGIEGVISDSGIAALNVPVLSSLPVVVGNVPVFSSISGRLIDSGNLLTSYINRNTFNSFNLNSGLLFNSGNYTAVGGAVTVASQCGSITTDPLTTISGSTSTVTITPPTVLGAFSVILLQLRAGGTNTAGQNILFTFDVAGFNDPIVVTILNGNTGALNGTIIFSYFIVR